ncbi:MAG: DUF393 domain-containing protein, partial [Pseudomonadales bacterium]|nr:DUF393 domain-containing protein [Pseudomonadales bacterium]
VYYDGECGFCHSFVRFLLAEDKNRQFQFSPLESEHFLKNISPEVRYKLPTSLVVLTPEGKVLTKSDGVAHCLESLGGLWRLSGVALRAFPKSIRDFGYDQIGKIRREIFSTPETECPLVHSSLRQRFV